MPWSPTRATSSSRGRAPGGVGKFVKQQLTGEGVPLMKCSGAGDLFLADLAADIHLLDLEGPGPLSIPPGVHVAHRAE